MRSPVSRWAVPDAVEEVLRQFPLPEYFGTITAGEVRDTICNKGNGE